MRPEKESMVRDIKGRMEASVFVILADYSGMNMPVDQELRSKLRGVDADYTVLKNRLVRTFTGELGLEKLNDGLAGPTAMVSGSGDITAVLKVIKDFVKEHQLPIVKVGSLDGVFLSTSDLAALADLPSREVLLAQMVGTLAAPMSGLVGVMSQKVASLLYVLKAVEAKKQEA